MIGDQHHGPEHKVHREQGARDQAREAAGPRQDEERNDDQGANDPLADQDNERGEDQDDTATQDEERDNDQDANDPRQDIQERLRRASVVIIGDTYANRPQRARPDIDRYQAGARKATKRLQRGQGRGQGRGSRGGGV